MKYFKVIDAKRSRELCPLRPSAEANQWLSDHPVGYWVEKMFESGDGDPSVPLDGEQIMVGTGILYKLSNQEYLRQELTGHDSAGYELWEPVFLFPIGYIGPGDHPKVKESDFYFEKVGPFGERDKQGFSHQAHLEALAESKTLIELK